MPSRPAIYEDPDDRPPPPPKPPAKRQHRPPSKLQGAKRAQWDEENRKIRARLDTIEKTLGGQAALAKAQEDREDLREMYAVALLQVTTLSETVRLAYERGMRLEVPGIAYTFIRLFDKGDQWWLARGDNTLDQWLELAIEHSRNGIPGVDYHNR